MEVPQAFIRAKELDRHQVVGTHALMRSWLKALKAVNNKTLSTASPSQLRLSYYS